MNSQVWKILPAHRFARFGLGVLAIGLACQLTLSAVEPATTRTFPPRPPDPPGPLAPHMSDMQRYSQKLGFSMQAKNGKLASFYVKKLEENVEHVKSHFEIYDQIPVGALIQMLEAPLRQMSESLESDNWAQSAERYESLIQTCNACHTASQRPYIIIKTAEGSPPFNQQFEPFKY